MSPASPDQLRQMAEVIVRTGLNLQPAQPLLVTEPYELHGVHPEAGALVEAARLAASGSEVAVVTSDPAGLRALAVAGDERGFETLVRNHVRRMEQHLARRGAFLFLLGSQPQLMAGVPADRLARLDRIKWRHLGPVIQRLVRGESQWTLAPAPSVPWADAAYSDLPAGQRLPALWRSVFEAMRVAPAVGGALCPDGISIESRPKAAPTADPITSWQTHLASLARRRDELNAARHRRIRYVGPGTDLSLELPGSHVWCTAQLTARSGVPFVVNLPTEEVFTAPHRDSASGTVRVARPVVHGGVAIDGIELEFHRGRVVSARARTGQDALDLLLATDSGAGRIGEVAVLPALMEGRPGDRPSAWQSSGRLFHHTLLDENSSPHIALGDAYRFCSSSLLPLALNSSQVHVDLPLDAKVELS